MTYTLALTFESPRTGKRTTKVTKGMPWEKAMDWKTSMLESNPACVEGRMWPEKGAK